MSAYAFPLYTLTHFCVFIWCIRMLVTYKAPGAGLTALIVAGLVYDNLIVSLGATIGIGSTLQMLSWPRFAMHAVLTPFMIIAVTQIAGAGGVQWAKSTGWRWITWALVVVLVIYGVFEHLIGLQTYPACFDGVLRYTANLAPSHFCYPGQEAVTGDGPPIPSIIGNFVTLAAGFSLWRRQRWPWLMAGALAMFVAASVPISTFGMAASNAGETLLLLSFAATINRFGASPRVPGGQLSVA